MKFRKNLFGVLALLILMGSCAIMTGVFSDASDNCDEIYGAETTNADACSGGAAIGSSVLMCITLPLALFLALLSWRNGAGIKTERRHQEQIAAMRDNRPQT